MQVLMTALLAAAGITLTATTPEIKENSILYGDTKVSCAKNGVITISTLKGVFATIACHYSVVNPAEKKTDWSPVKEEDCTMSYQDRKFTWVLNRKAFGKTWKAVDQTLEILENGQLKLSIKEYPAPEGLKLFDNCIYTHFPIPAINGKSVQFQGKEVKMTVGKAPISRIQLPSVRGIKGFTYIFPLGQGSVTLFSECFNGLTAFNRTGKVRLTWFLPPSGAGTLIIDVK